MKKNLLLFIAVFYTLLISGQIPNSGFENWKNYETLKPDNWNTYGTITQVNSGEGNYAIRMERDKSGLLGPGAILFGQPSGDNISGGTPFTGRPDSLILTAKYDIEPGDTGFIFVLFKKQGIPVSNDTFFITGTHTSDYLRIANKLHYNLNVTPDSLVIALTSTNPSSESGYGYLTIDTVYFTNTTANIPNSGFQSWTKKSIEEPEGWITNNLLFYNSGELSITKSTDSYAGTYAMEIKSMSFQGYYQRGFALNGKLTNNGNILPGFPVLEKFNMFSGYYKCLSINGDKPMMSIFLFKAGSMIGMGSLSCSATLNYSRFNIPIQYYSDIVPDSAAILIMSSENNYSLGNSTLIIDSLLLFTGSVPSPAGAISGSKTICKGASATYTVPAIEGAETYIWSLPNGATGSSTTNSINVNFGKDAVSGNIRVWGQNEFGIGLISLFSVTVNNCNSEIPQSSQNEFILGPNPTNGILKIEPGILLDAHANIRIFNMLGEQVFNLSNTHETISEINISNIPNGIYLIKLESNGKTFLQKIIKK